MVLPSPRREVWTCVLWALLALLAQGCASVPERTPITEEAYPDALVLGVTGLRFWGDQNLPIAEDLPDDITLDEVRTLFPGIAGRELNFLAISGGGANGAFAAGLLNGWTDSGTRPEFNVVTGISTGALIAPFAFLGPEYDALLEKFYTQYSTKDLVTERGWLRTFIGGREAGFDTDLLREKLAEYINEDLMRAIAAEHERGRMLFIGTTNLDAGRPVTWDIGAIASSRKPGALDLIRDVILASASIPIAFPPIMIDVESKGQQYDEMHTDGGVSRQSFMFYLESNEWVEDMRIVGQPRAFIIRNSKLEPEWQAVDRRVFQIAGRSASALVQSQGLGDLYREYLGARKFGFDFNLAYIPREFDAEANEMFDKEYMQALYRLGYELAIDGYPWRKAPPGLVQP